MPADSPTAGACPDWADRAALPEIMTASSSTNPEFWAGILNVVNRLAANIAADTDIDADDIVSDTMFALANHAARNPAWVTDGRDKSNYLAVVTLRLAGRLVRKREHLKLELAAAALPAPNSFDRADAWNQIVDTFEGVDVQREFVSEYNATRIRKIVRTAGGVEAILNRWENDNITPEETYALFNPWGTSTGGSNMPPANVDAWQPPTQRTQESVANMLRTAGTYADDLWNLAVREATRYDMRSRQHQRRGHRRAA